jgi:hypothetical protein
VTAAPTLHAENGGLFEVRRILPRPGGAVDLVIVFKARGRKPAFSAYRREIDGRWKALHGAWADVDEAVAAVPHADRYSPVVYDPLIRFLSKAVVTEPDWEAELEYRRSQADYTYDTPNDEGDND